MLQGRTLVYGALLTGALLSATALGADGAPPPLPEAPSTTAWEVRVYPVADLVIPYSPVCSPGDAGCGAVDFEPLIDLLELKTGSECWRAEGPGSILASPESLSLVISQTPELHQRVAELLAEVRAANDLTICISLEVFKLPSESPAPLTGSGRHLAGLVDPAGRSRLLEQLAAVDSGLVHSPRITIFNGQKGSVASADGWEFTFCGTASNDHRYVTLVIDGRCASSVLPPQQMLVPDGYSSIRELEECGLCLITTVEVVSEREQPARAVDLDSESDRRPAPQRFPVPIQRLDDSSPDASLGSALRDDSLSRRLVSTPLEFERRLDPPEIDDAARPPSLHFLPRTASLINARIAPHDSRPATTETGESQDVIAEFAPANATIGLWKDCDSLRFCPFEPSAWANARATAGLRNLVDWALQHRESFAAHSPYFPDSPVAQWIGREELRTWRPNGSALQGPHAPRFRPAEPNPRMAMIFPPISGGANSHSAASPTPLLAPTAPRPASGGRVVNADDGDPPARVDGRAGWRLNRHIVPDPSGEAWEFRDNVATIAGEALDDEPITERVRAVAPPSDPEASEPQSPRSSSPVDDLHSAADKLDQAGLSERAGEIRRLAIELDADMQQALERLDSQRETLRRWRFAPAEGDLTP